MITKVTVPLIRESKVVGTQVTYKFFGMRIYKKVLYLPENYGIDLYENYQTSI